jgi:phospholipid/cholesterol/gamma-HCH transport system ATP-binding protein
MKPPIVELADVHLQFGDNKILTGVNLRVEDGERLVVLGQSGGGKSTILRLILGMLRPNSGSVRVRGHEIPRMGRRRLNLLRQRMGMVYQYSALISSMTVRDNLALPLQELTRMKTKEIDALILKNLHRVGMEEHLEKLPSELSGGMRKRVSLARAMMLEPELILYDEPSAGLDPIISTIIDELMVAVSEHTGAASIIVTHELESAFKVATRIAMLYEGVIIADGTPDEFRHHPDERVRNFIEGTPPEDLSFDI